MVCEVHAFIVTSPIGNYTVEVCASGVHKINNSREVTNDNFLDLGKATVAIESWPDCPKAVVVVANDVRRWMSWFFAENVADKEPAVEICPSLADPASNAFRHRVWLTLRREVRFGQTATYGQLAGLCGSPGAARAVGSAMSNNPVSLLVPCHRVLPSDGSVGNYAKASRNAVKAWLLAHEQQRVKR